jgi:hypothetical protein
VGKKCGTFLIEFMHFKAEPPVWQLAATVVGNGAARPHPFHQGNNNNKKVPESGGNGSISKKRVSFPQLPPESPVPPGVFLYQNGGPPCPNNKRRRILSLVPSPSPFSPKLARRNRRMASVRMSRLNRSTDSHQATEGIRPSSPPASSFHENGSPSLAFFGG